MRTGRIKQGYGTIQRDIMTMDIDIYSKAVYCLLVSYAGEKVSCFPSLNTMCKDLKISKPTIIKALKELIVHKLIVADKKKSKSGEFSNNIYYPMYIMEEIDDPTGVVNEVNQVVNKVDNVVNQVDPKNNSKEYNNSLLNNKEVINGVLPFSETDLKPKRKKFIPPTIEEVLLIIKEKKRAQKFINHYQGNGWIVGRVKMVDWRATAHNWVLDQEEEIKQSTNGTTIIF